jgi:hypothetical protein
MMAMIQGIAQIRIHEKVKWTLEWELIFVSTTKDEVDVI